MILAGPAHAEALAAIHRRAFPVAQRWDAAVMATQLGLCGTWGYIDPAGGLVLARNAADEAELLTLAVVPAARRAGRGAALLRAALAEAQRRGAAAMFLEVGSRNAAARSLYARAGFLQVGQRRGYYSDGDDALVLRHDL